MQRYNLISTLVFFIWGVYITVVSLRMGIGTITDPGPGLSPFITGMLMGMIAGGMFIKIYLQSHSKRQELLGEANTLWHKKSVVTVVIMLIYAIMIERLGFLTVTLLILFILYKVVGGMSLKASLGGAILTTVIAYLLFKVFLNVALPVGPLGV